MNVKDIVCEEQSADCCKQRSATADTSALEIDRNLSSRWLVDLLPVIGTDDDRRIDCQLAFNSGEISLYTQKNREIKSHYNAEQGYRGT